MLHADIESLEVSYEEKDYGVDLYAEADCEVQEPERSVGFRGSMEIYNIRLWVTVFDEDGEEVTIEDQKHFNSEVLRQHRKAIDMALTESYQEECYCYG